MKSANNYFCILSFEQGKRLNLLKLQLMNAQKRVASLTLRRPNVKELINRFGVSEKEDQVFVTELLCLLRSPGETKALGLDILRGLVHNMAQDLKGGRHQWSEGVKNFFLVLQSVCGPKILRIFGANLSGPSETTIKNEIKRLSDGYDVSPGIHEGNIRRAIEFYTSIQYRGPFVLAEDGTAVYPCVQLSQCGQRLYGLCGSHGCECVTSKLSFIHTIENRGCSREAYDELERVVMGGKIAPYIYAYMLVPAAPSIPAYPIGVCSTCNSFDAAHILNMWTVVDTLWDRCGGNEVGPILGHAGDGAANTVKAMEALSVNQKPTSTHRLITLSAPGFQVSGRVEVAKKLVSHISIQDGRHVQKKVMCVLDSDIREMKICGKFVTMAYIRAMVMDYTGKRDLRVTASMFTTAARQNVLRAQALCHPSTQRLLVEWGSAKDIDVSGLVAYLDAINQQWDAVFSRLMSHEDRIRKLSYACHFLVIWHAQVLYLNKVERDGRKRTKNPSRVPLQDTLKKRFITMQGCRHLILSCQSYIVLMMVFRDYFPGLPLECHQASSNPLEEFFAAALGFGLQLANTRSGTAKDFFSAARREVQLLRARCGPKGVQIPSSNTRKHTEILIHREEDPAAVR